MRVDVKTAVKKSGSSQARSGVLIPLASFATGLTGRARRPFWLAKHPRLWLRSLLVSWSWCRWVSCWPWSCSAFGRGQGWPHHRRRLDRHRVRPRSKHAREQRGGRVRGGAQPDAARAGAGLPPGRAGGVRSDLPPHGGSWGRAGGRGGAGQRVIPWSWACWQGACFEAGGADRGHFHPGDAPVGGHPRARGGSRPGTRWSAWGRTWLLCIGIVIGELAVGHIAAARIRKRADARGVQRHALPCAGVAAGIRGAPWAWFVPVILAYVIALRAGAVYERRAAPEARRARANPGCAAASGARSRSRVPRRPAGLLSPLSRGEGERLHRFDRSLSGPSRSAGDVTSLDDLRTPLLG